MPIIFLVKDSMIFHGTWSYYKTYLVDRLCCLGHTVILRWGYNTSQMCPSEECDHSRMEDKGVGLGSSIVGPVIYSIRVGRL
jgi:hypothetical protein